MRSLASVVLILAAGAANAWEPPRVAMSAKDFELIYPPTEASAAALDLEAMAADLGLDLVPKWVENRAHPDPEVVKRFQSIWPAAREYLEQELASPEERIGQPAAALSRFLAEHETEIERIADRLTGRGEAVWEMDVRAGTEAPLPNLLGHNQLTRLLGARVLLLERRGEHDAALQGLEGMWRLTQGLASRPDVISHVIAMTETKYVVGILRKVDAPALEWTERMRGRGFFEAYLAALQNEAWHRLGDPDLSDQAPVVSRVARRFAEGLLEKGPCVWSRDELHHRMEVAASAEEPPYEVIAIDSLDDFVGILARWYRLLLDEELTALVLEARGERAASRDRAWPPQLLRLDSDVCSGERWSYRRSANGSVALSYEGHAPDSEPRGLVLPLSFRALPPPTPTPTRSPAGPTLTPTPAAHRLTSE